MVLIRIGLDIQMRIKEGTQRELGDKDRSSPLLKKLPVLETWDVKQTIRRIRLQ